MDEEQENSNMNIPGESVIAQVILKQRNVGISFRLSSKSMQRDEFNCVMERLSVKIINCMYLPVDALAVTTNYDLPL